MAALLLFPERWRTQQPARRQDIALGHPLAKNLLLSCFNSAQDMFYAPFNYARQTTTGAGTHTVSGTNAGLAATYNGSSQFSSMLIDLSPHSKVTLFWRAWSPSYTSSDAPYFEYTTSTGAGGNGIFIDPNWSGGAAIAVNVTAAGAFYATHYTRPPAGQWNSFMVVTDRTLAAATRAVYINGALMTPTVDITTLGAGTSWANSTLYFFSRAGSSLFNSGKLQCLNIWTETKSYGDAKAMHEAPYQFLRPNMTPRYFLPSAGGGGGAAAHRWFLTG